MILQLIPLIARCCVLQRNRKPSHPSRHVVGAVLNRSRAAKCSFDLCERALLRKEKLLGFVRFWKHRKNDPAAGSPTATLLRLLLPLLIKYRLSFRPRPVQQPVFRQPSETTTGGVYKWQGRNRHSLMSCAYETFLVARPIIAILGPNRVYVIPVVPRSFGSSGSPCNGNLVLTDIVVRVSPRTLRSITDLLLPKISP